MTVDEVILSVTEEAGKLVKIVCSSPIGAEYKKQILRRIEGGRFLLERYTPDKVFHIPIDGKDLEKCLKTQVFAGYKQTEVYFTDSALTVLTNGKGTVTVRRRKAETLMEAAHNRKKKYIFAEGEDIPALKDLGVFTAENKVAASMQDKFRQINRFIETVDDVLRDPPKELTVLDFGCGKSYLTFLLYYYLTVKKSVKTRVIGYDLKEDVVEKCNAAAKKYGYEGLEFIRADVSKDRLYGEKTDMVVTLHACDTATDHALYFAVKHGAKYIFSVPCCQHEINAQIRGKDDYEIFTGHGLIKERFSALLTDAVRVKALENAGYRVDCLEFVGFDTSPKNLMIRATFTGAPPVNNEELKSLLSKYNVRQTLLDLLDEGGQRKTGGTK
ncbi:MAG: SAM-dependent methyltransferase [Clostridia bacterium]|nr:SAM-dependent methyltransferase [Clostridia bacterium]